MSTTVYAFRGRNDDGNETTATWKAAQNTTWVQARDANFRIRFGVQNDTGPINNLDVQLQYSLNGTDWVAVNASSSYVRSSASSNVADAANLTEQLTGGSGTFEGATAFDEVNGICGGTSYDIASTEYFEHEFCCQVRSAEAANGIQIWLRTINSDSGLPWTTYNVTATLWVGWMPLSAAPSADNWGNLDDSLAFDLTAGPTPLTVTPDADAWQNLADSVSIYRTEARAGWEDALAFIKTTGLFADLPADSAANLADAIETLRQGFLTADIPADSAANLADSLDALFMGFLTADLPADSAANLADSLDTLLMAFLTADLPADDAANLADALEVLRMGALSADLPADDAANLADVLEIYAAYFATLSDDALFADDSVVVELGTVSLPLTVELSDALETLADALDVLLSGLLVADLPADDAANLDDALAVLYMALLTADLPSDSAANLADILEAIEDYFANLSDDALAVNDSLAVELTGEVTPLTVELSDAMENFADSAELTLVVWTLLVDLADDATNLSDSLFILLQLGPGWADILTLFETLNVNQTDSAANLDDGQLQLGADHELTFDEDDLNQWADSSTFILADIVNLTVNLADDATNLDDSLSALVQTRAGWEDELGAIEGLNASETDDAANLADSYESIYGLLVSSIDSAENSLDAIAALRDLLVNLSADDAANSLDAIAALRELLVNFSDDNVANLADALTAITPDVGDLLISLPVDSMTNASDALDGFMTLNALIADDAANFLDGASVSTSGTLRPNRGMRHYRDTRRR